MMAGEGVITIGGLGLYEVLQGKRRAVEWASCTAISVEDPDMG